MFWWRGNGLWMGLLVALIIVSAGKSLGPKGVPIGFAATAVIVFCLKSVFEESSLYSIPWKVWPLVLMLLAVLLFFLAR